MGWIFLAPVLLLSSFILFMTVVAGAKEHREPLQTIQLENNTIEIQRYEFGGAVGVRGIELEQRRRLVPGLYLIKSLDFFPLAYEVTMAVETPSTVKVHAKGSYSDHDHEVDKTYSIKNWVYF